jgi:hypothetical protein
MKAVDVDELSMPEPAVDSARSGRYVGSTWRKGYANLGARTRALSRLATILHPREPDEILRSRLLVASTRQRGTLSVFELEPDYR